MIFHKFIFSTLFFLFLLLQTIVAQTSLFIPRNIQKEYEKGTRSYDGLPGPKYWINSTDYTIKAELIPETRTVKGRAWITFYNNSPDSLNQYVFRLYNDIFKKGNMRDFGIDPADINDGVDIDTLIINGIGVNFKAREYRVMRYGTNLTVSNFPYKVGPGSFAKIEVAWSVVIPSNSRLRMGAYNDSTFYVAYWYPQVAVYDDIDGWDRQNYTGSVEFYNDFGNFDVELTLPSGYVVWATGVLQNAEKLLRPDIFEKYKTALSSDEVVRIITEEDYKKGEVITGTGKNTWKFVAEKVPDFSFAAGKGYLWDGSSVEVDYNSGRRTFVDAAYPPGIKYWDEVALFARLSVEYLSHEWPAIPFPYPKVTSFNGERTRAGGMETPMMCNNGSYSSRGGQIGVTIHEIAHNYMPFFMGTNERKYAWMDEGWASFFTLDLVKRLEPGEDEMPGVVSALSSSLGNETMLPLMTPSYAALTQGYGLMAYQQPAVAYLILKDFLGDELFKKALQDYMNNWNGKHPLPYDFFFTFNRVAGEDLAWFWKPWFFERGYADLAVEEVKEFRVKKFNIHTRNYGSYPVPIDLEVTYADGSREKFFKPASVWKNGANRFEFVIETGKEFKKVEIISRLSPDSNPRNNSYSLK